ncbi:hypothetical protein [Bradyrhizobium sp. S69]|uniref:hypothetical protein n=1 Tax=Bradyrhizobium sp. S69 TaxID=1641856 RepID=UPI001FEE3EDC|nr:hypothetical protein [Bradyrhizobium sp. S69]
MSSSFAAAKPLSAKTSSADAMISAGRSVLRLRRFGGWFGMDAPVNDFKVINLARLSRQ